jgi:hypothetical protein
MTTATEPIVPPADNYLGLIAAFRARVRELGISYETIDELAGWTSRYASKVLGEEPLRHMGVMAFDTMLATLGLKLIAVPDPEKLEKIKNHRHFVPRKHRLRAAAKHAQVVRRVTRPFLTEIGSKGGLARSENLVPRRRQAIARKGGLARAERLSAEARSASAKKAAKARWSKPKLVMS